MWEQGFLGYNASFMLDFVVTALIAVVPILVYSIYVVKYQRNYHLHKKLQILLGVVLLVAVTAFEVDMQYHGGWKNIINKDPDFPRMDSEQLASVQKLLYFHLIFAISTPIVWIITTVLALKHFPKPVQPGPHSELHKKLGWFSTVDLVMTSVTGLLFYYVAFIR